MEFLFLIDPTVRVACPFCDQGNSPRAKICAHCRRELADNPEWHSNLAAHKRFVSGAVTFLVVALFGALAWIMWLTKEEDDRINRISAMDAPQAAYQQGQTNAAPAPQLARRSPVTPIPFLTLTAPVEVTLRYGKVTLAPGTQLRPIGATARVVTAQYGTETVAIPIEQTSLGHR